MLRRSRDVVVPGEGFQAATRAEVPHGTVARGRYRDSWLRVVINDVGR